jgi:ubiquinone/menaquinone biosynthesis C-methylase UbiE
MFQFGRSLADRSSRFRRWSSRFFYEYASSLDKGGEITVMNYGYVALDPKAQPVSLDAKDEHNRYCIQLYHKVASAIDLRGLDVLEVGSGRGGGAAYIKSYLGPSSMTGVELAENAVTFCQSYYASNGLRFLHGDAEDLSFPDATFDAVVNVESSHCYGEMAQFLREVNRVLRPRGHLLWADTRPLHHLDALYADIRQSGFEVIKEESITANVLAAMNLQTERNRDLTKRIVPWYFRKAFLHFGGVEGKSYIYKLLNKGELEYLHLVLRKTA